MVKRHHVTTASDGPAYLERELRTLSADGKRIVSIMWMPERYGADGRMVSGYVIVSEAACDLGPCNAPLALDTGLLVRAFRFWHCPTLPQATHCDSASAFTLQLNEVQMRN